MRAYGRATLLWCPLDCPGSTCTAPWRPYCTSLAPSSPTRPYIKASLRSNLPASSRLMECRSCSSCWLPSRTLSKFALVCPLLLTLFLLRPNFYPLPDDSPSSAAYIDTCLLQMPMKLIHCLQMSHQFHPCTPSPCYFQRGQSPWPAFWSCSDYSNSSANSMLVLSYSFCDSYA